MDKQIKVSYYTAYKVGGLLYTPASDKAIAKKLISKEYDCLTSVALCLEDSIDDKALPMAEQQLKQTLTQLLYCNTSLPLVFVRVRDCDHFKRIHDLLKEEEAVIDGYIFPKFDLTNSSTYCKSILDYNQKRQKPLYLMPILESKSIADTGNRVNTLREIKRQLDDIKQYVLNIRVGGNDFSNIYGLRRSETQTIYDIGVIRDILVDIINVFSSDYVISGPVWEYFDDRRSDLWKDGLKRELELDLLNGFFGKTAIHPSQLPIIYESLKVSRTALKRFIRKYRVNTSVAAGDSAFDIPMLNQADIAIVPHELQSLVKSEKTIVCDTDRLFSDEICKIISMLSM